MTRRLALLAPLLPLMAAGGVAALGSDLPPVDIPYFLDAADVLLSGGWAQTFSDPGLQAGPLQLLLLGAGDRLAALTGASSATFLAIAIEVGLVALLVAAVGALLHGRRGSLPALCAVGLAAIAADVPRQAFLAGHPAQVAIPCLWLLAGVAARRGRPIVAGALLGASAGLEVWGLLGMVMLLLAPRWRQVLAGTSTALGVVLALFLPFVLAGDFRMFDLAWQVREQSLVALLVAPGSDFSWPLRLVQGGAALIAGGLVARALRSQDLTVWLVPLLVVTVRLALDPQALNSWYWLGLETLGIAAAAEVATGDLVRKLSRPRQRLAES